MVQKGAPMKTKDDVARTEARIFCPLTSTFNHVPPSLAREKEEFQHTVLSGFRREFVTLWLNGFHVLVVARANFVHVRNIPVKQFLSIFIVLLLRYLPFKIEIILDRKGGKFLYESWKRE